MEDTPNELTIRQAAAILARSPAWIRRLVQQGRLPVRREGTGNRTTCFVSRAAVDALRQSWAEQPPRVGRPRHPSAKDIDQ